MEMDPDTCYTLWRNTYSIVMTSGARRKKYLGVKCDVVIYDVTNQIFECDTDKALKPTDRLSQRVSGW